MGAGADIGVAGGAERGFLGAGAEIRCAGGLFRGERGLGASILFAGGWGGILEWYGPHSSGKTR